MERYSSGYARVGRVHQNITDRVRTAGPAFIPHVERRQRTLRHIRAAWRRRAAVTGVLAAAIAVTIAFVG